MREILFRGKRLDNGEWAYGSLSMEYFTECGSVMISPTSDTCYKVVPETVGQFTGIIDKNGKRIYEGDMVLAYDMFGRKDDCGVVNWNNLFCAWHIGKNSMYGNRIATYEVIGNIYDGEDVSGD